MKTKSEIAKDIWNRKGYRNKMSIIHTGLPGFWKGKKRSKSTKGKISLTKHGCVPWNKGKNELTKDINLWRRLHRHKKGISKRYRHEILRTPEQIKQRRRFHKQRYRALKKKGGPLPIKRIQMVYEDNIKKYGTLTCYLCEKSISFGKDHLEHKIPLSRGGTNAYNNLGIAHQICNNKKFNKTEKEYRKGEKYHGKRYF